MDIISAYVREEWYYSAKQLETIFCFENDEDLLLRFIKELLSRSILKIKSESDKQDDSLEFNNYSDSMYLQRSFKFSFVGIIICCNRLIYAYPKYIGECKPLPYPNYVPQQELAQVIRVIEKYSREKAKQDIYDIDLFAYEDESGKNRILSVMLFLLEDYAANGTYAADEVIIEINGSNDILWQKTIDESYPIISHKKPYYVELYTRRNINNDFDYLKRLHEFVITKCSYEVERAGLTDFFSLPTAYISDEEESTFGETEQIINIIDATISQTFDDRKLSVLTALKLYFKSDKVLLGENELQLIGTRSFNQIWEKVCADVFTSQKDEFVDQIEPYIDYTIINKNFGGKTPTLVGLIKQPIWKRYRKGAKGIAKNTIIPDYLRFEPNNKQTGYVFYILDAKYYCPDWKNKSIEDQPGVEDIAKQYLYYLAYRDILDFCKVNEVKNYFLMPKRKNEDKIPGYAKMDILRNLGLGVIEVRMLDPQMMYDCYLHNKKLNLTELD